jgi:hypothetical protein
VTRVVLVPGVLALLPAYASLDDPVADLRAAALAAVAWLGREVEVLADPQGERVAAHLLAETTRSGDEPSYLVVGNGSARRTEKAPGHLDERATAFDDDLRAALTSRHPNWPSNELGQSLLACLDGISRLPEVLPPGIVPTVDYDDDPFGVQYWVMRWQT